MIILTLIPNPYTLILIQFFAKNFSATESEKYFHQISFFFLVISTKNPQILPIISIVFKYILFESSSGTPCDFLMNTSNPIVGQDKSTCMGAGAWVGGKGNSRGEWGSAQISLRLWQGHGKKQGNPNLLKSH